MNEPRDRLFGKDDGMSETQRRANNTTRILAYLQQHGRAMNHELIPIGGMRAMGRCWEIGKEHDLQIRHVKGGEWEVVYLGPKRQGQMGHGV
jgi:hypothetical protein